MKKLFTLLGLVVMFGIVTANATTITLNLNGPGTPYENIEAASDRPVQYGGTPVNITSNNFQYTGNSLYISPKSGYKISSCTTSTPDISNGFNSSSKGYYSLSNGELSISINDAEMDAVFDITVIEDDTPTVTYPYYIPIQYSNADLVESASFNSVTLTNKDQIEVTQENQGGYGSLLITLVPGIQIQTNVTASYETESTGTNNLSPYYDSDEGTIIIGGIPLATATKVIVNFEEVSTQPNVILDFTGMANAYSNVTVYEVAEGQTPKEITISQSPFTYEFTYSKGAIFVFPKTNIIIQQANCTYQGQLNSTFTPVAVSASGIESLKSQYNLSDLSENDWYFNFDTSNINQNGCSVIFTLGNSSSSNTPSSTYIYIDYSNASVVESISFNTVDQDDNDAIEVTPDLRGDTGTLVITLKEGAAVNGATATYDTASSNGINITGIYYTAAENNKPATITVPGIPYATATNLNITFTNENTTDEEYTVTINLYASGLTINDCVESVMVNSSTVDFTGTPITINANVENAVVITLKSGYIFTMSREGTTQTTLNSNVYSKTFDANVNSQIDLMISLAPNVEVPVEFAITNYPGLIGSLGWNGVTTTVSDEDLEDYTVAFNSSMTTGTLVINFSKNEEDILYYVVTKVNVEIDGVAVDVTLADDGSSASFSIPSTAQEVAVTFVATENEAAGVNSVEKAFNGEEVIYNLQGVRVNGNNLVKGIYIINGKKVVVK